MCDECDYEDVVKECEELLELVEDLPEAAEEFAASVEEKTESIRDWITENEHVTEKQKEAIQNMRAGADKWVNR